MEIMLRNLFLSELRNRLFGLPGEEIEERLSFYNEMINDRMEEGLSEEEAVAAIGPVEEIAEQIMSTAPVQPVTIAPAWDGTVYSQQPEGFGQQPGMDAPPLYGGDYPKYAEEPKHSGGGMKTLLLILGFPLWFPLMAAFLVVWLALTVAVFSVILAFWVTAAGLAAGVAAGLFYAIVCFFLGKTFSAFAWIGTGCILAGVSILMFLCGGAVTKGMFGFIKFSTRCVMKLFRRKGKAS